MGFLYFRGLDPDQDTSPPDNEISARYDPKTEQYELSSVLGETTVRTPDEAVDWVANQFLAVETSVDTDPVLIELAEEIHGLGRSGVRGLVETFETLNAIREADVDALADVPYVNEEIATSLQTTLEDVEPIGEDDPTQLERELRAIDRPLILDFQEGPISGELVPSGASEPKYSSNAFGGVEPDDR